MEDGVQNLVTQAVFFGFLNHVKVHRHWLVEIGNYLTAFSHSLSRSLIRNRIWISQLFFAISCYDKCRKKSFSERRNYVLAVLCNLKFLYKNMQSKKNFSKVGLKPLTVELNQSLKSHAVVFKAILSFLKILCPKNKTYLSEGVRD